MWDGDRSPRSNWKCLRVGGMDGMLTRNTSSRDTADSREMCQERQRSASDKCEVCERKPIPCGSRWNTAEDSGGLGGLLLCHVCVLLGITQEISSQWKFAEGRMWGSHPECGRVAAWGSVVGSVTVQSHLAVRPGTGRSLISAGGTEGPPNVTTGRPVQREDSESSGKVKHKCLHKIIYFI